MATKMMMGVSSALGARDTLARMAAENRPVRSATPAPSITVSTKPSGAKLVRVRGMSTNRRRRFSEVARLTAVRVSPVAGFTADSPAEAAIIEPTKRAAIIQTKMTTGSGSLLPTRSTTPRNPACAIDAPSNQYGVNLGQRRA